MNYMCFQCLERKPPEAFRLRKSVTTGKQYRGGVCRACFGAKANTWRKNNPDKVRKYNAFQKSKNPEYDKRRAIESHFIRKFGITTVERDQMLADQGGVCAICNIDEATGKGWCVDHCHKTGKIRAILCSHCNTMLGHAKDNPETLRAAAVYLEMFKW